MSKRKHSSLGAMALLAVAVSSPAAAQTFQNYRCADGTQFIVGFFEYDKRAHLQIDGRAVTLGKALWPFRRALFGRRRHVEDRKDRHHGQTREAAGDGVRT